MTESVSSRDGTGDQRPHPYRWLVVAGVFALAFVLLYLWAVRTEGGQWLDIQLFAKAQSSNGLVVESAGLVRRGLPLALAVAYVAVAGVALLRGRLRHGLVTAVMIVLSAGAARGLRDVALDRPYLGEHGYVENTFPSGHVTVSAALAVALVMLAPSRYRRGASALVGLVLVGACMASVLGHAHRPSDVLGAVLLVGAFASLVLTTGFVRADERA